MVVSGGADLAQQFERVGVVHQHLIEFDVRHIEQPVLAIDGQRTRIDQSIGDHVFGYVGGD